MNPLQVPQQGPYGDGGPFRGHFASLSKTSSFGFPSKVALPQGPLDGIPHRDAPPLEPSFIHLSKSPVYKPPPPTHTHTPGYPQMERGPHGERCLYLETFLIYIPGSPVK